jgi:hypothetical protein
MGDIYKRVSQECFSEYDNDNVMVLYMPKRYGLQGLIIIIIVLHMGVGATAGSSHKCVTFGHGVPDGRHPQHGE